MRLHHSFITHFSPNKAQVVIMRNLTINMASCKDIFQCLSFFYSWSQSRELDNFWSHARTYFGLWFPLWRLITSDPLRVRWKEPFHGCPSSFVLTYWPGGVTSVCLFIIAQYVEKFEFKTTEFNLDFPNRAISWAPNCPSSFVLTYWPRRGDMRVLVQHCSICLKILIQN